MIRTIADLPFRRLPPDELLGIAWDRPGFVDDDFTGFGFGLVPRLRLAATAPLDEVRSGPNPGAQYALAAPLVLALHSAERSPGSGPDDDFDLELEAEGERLHVPLARFLAVWLPRLPELHGCTDLVLALCNPTGYPIPRPPALPPSCRFWYGVSDVDSFAERDVDGQPFHGLSATRWMMR